MDIYSIYKATNVVNGKSYIGFTKNITQRFKAHLRSANNGSNHAFHRAIRKYGFDSFIVETIFQGTDRSSILDWAEQHFIKEYNTHSLYGHGYNMTYGGEGRVASGKDNGMWGKKHSEETKAKIVAYDKSGALNPMYGRKHSVETRIKIGAYDKAGTNNPMYGKSHSEKTKKIQSEKRKANPTDISGSKNPGARTYIFTSPTGDKYEVTGGFKTFCKQHGLAHQVMQKSIGTGKITLKIPRSRATEELLNSLEWEVTVKSVT